MDTEIQNANPTVKDIADLPTRLGKPTEPERSKLDELFARLDGPPAWASDPFASYLSSPAGSVSGSSEDGQARPEGIDAEEYEPIDEQEIYDLISTISDPEHPLTLGALSVVNLADIKLEPLKGVQATTKEQEEEEKRMKNGGKKKRDPRKEIMVCTVDITPTITHCSLATVIGLGVRVRLERSLPPRFRVEVRIKEGTHSTGDQVTKQLGDKERVAAALENQQLMDVVTNMLKTCR